MKQNFVAVFCPGVIVSGGVSVNVNVSTHLSAYALISSLLHLRTPAQSKMAAAVKGYAGPGSWAASYLQCLIVAPTYLYRSLSLFSLLL